MYSFRLRFRASNAVKLGLEENARTLANRENIEIDLRAHGRDTTKAIRDSEQLVVIGKGFDSIEDAQTAGLLTQDRLIIAFARLRFPADFGGRAAKSAWTAAGLKWLEEETGVRCLNDVHGLQVYETEPEPKFFGANAAGTILKSEETTLSVLKDAFAIEPVLNEKRRLAFELFSASSFTTYVDARFMLLMMAIETLIIQDLRPSEELKLIDDLTKSAKESTITNKEAIISALNFLRYESIGAAGRRLASNLKGPYDNKPPDKFFVQCYNLRSKLVHGHTPRPSFEEVNAINAPLETFAADLISYPEFQS